MSRTFNINKIKAKEAGEKFFSNGRLCKKCNTDKRFTATSSCVKCKEIYYKTKRKKNERKYSVTKYGITLDQYNEMLKAQNCVCAICEQPEKSLNGKGTGLKPLAIDHCHETGKVRKLLCSRCNIGIGSLKHSPDLLRKAALYCEEV